MLKKKSRHKERVIHLSSFLLLFITIPSIKAFAVITVTYDNKSSGTTGLSNSNSLTFSHTTGSGSDRILIVGVSVEGANVNSVTYNATALTRLATITNTVKVEMWYLVAPAAGTHNVVISLSASASVVGGSQSFYQVDQTTPFGTTVTNSGNSATASAVVSSAVNEMVVDASGTDFFDPSVGAGQTLGYAQSAFNNRGGGSREAGAASVTMSWSISLSDKWAIIAVPIKPAAVLPIQLSSFNADCRGDKVEISWTTASEMNNNFFTVEKSADNELFKELAIVNGAGNSSTLKTYQVTDINPSEGTSYYRLKQTDYNGHAEYFPVVSVQNCSTSQKLQVFFTPESSMNSAMLTYKLPGPGRINIKLFNVLGELVKQSDKVESEPGTYHYTPFVKETGDKPKNYIALFQYRDQMISCRFIR